MRVSIVLPGSAHFGAERATAIDLCVVDLIGSSRFRDDTTVHCHPVEEPFPDFNTRFLPRASSHWRCAQNFAASVQDAGAEVIVVHHEEQIALAMARALEDADIPVILHRHAAVPPPHGPLDRWRELMRNSRFASTVWPSNASRAPFIARQPTLAAYTSLAPAGIDLSKWTPAPRREQEVLFVGRGHWEHGALEAAAGAARAIESNPDWRLRFVLSSSDDDIFRASEISGVLASLGERAKVEIDLPYDQLKAALERAAIALAPSNDVTAFDRTALEAMAGGAALVHWGRGALKELAPEAGLALGRVSVDTVAAAISKLVENESMREAFAAAGTQQCKRFSALNSASHLDAKYEVVALREADPAPAPVNLSRQVGALLGDRDRR